MIYNYEEIINVVTSLFFVYNQEVLVEFYFPIGLDPATAYRLRHVTKTVVGPSRTMLPRGGRRNTASMEPLPGLSAG